MTDYKELIPVDTELIRRLRRDGEHEAAALLVEAHQASLKKDWESGRLNNLRVEARVRMRKWWALKKSSQNKKQQQKMVGCET